MLAWVYQNSGRISDGWISWPDTIFEEKKKKLIFCIVYFKCLAVAKIIIRLDKIRNIDAI